jgi:hypothetical protein
MSTQFDRVLHSVLGNLPWVVPVYVTLIIIFTLVLVWAATHQGSVVLGDGDLRVRLFGIAADSLKTVIGALLGSLSVAAEAMWKATKE